MALQLPPLAFIALRYGAVALISYAAARRAPLGRLSPAVEAEMDAAPAGLQMRKDAGQISGSARFVRDWRAGRFGPRFRVDGTALARLRIRRVA